jgi:hypothetical protein
MRQCSGALGSPRGFVPSFGALRDADNRRNAMAAKRPMISFNRSKFWRRTWFVVLCMVAAAVAVVGWRLVGEWSHHDVVARAVPSAPFVDSRAPSTTVSGLEDPPLQADGRPSDFSVEEWGALTEAMRLADQPEAELNRVVDYLRFQKRFERWQSLLESPEVDLRRQLASTLIERLPDRLKAGDVSMGEAQLLLAALWSDLEPDEARRRQRVEEGTQVLNGVAPRSGEAQDRRDASQLAEYKRRESAILLEYQSRPEGQRDAALLEAQLEDARRAVYGAN